MAKEQHVNTQYVPGCGPEKDRLCCRNSEQCYKESMYVNGKILYTGICCRDW
ncbi:hypothetical protein [Metasolibacillus meyeri]|uniref:hypothetical protein n=1 Tax=Metasolibacillus meyeri TaxID=1071052 RepID=UPI00187D1706|nr:hypothetical protein [Metasolibacillus meyeri]